MADDAIDKTTKTQVVSWLLQQGLSTVLLVGLAIYIIHRDQEERKLEHVQQQRDVLQLQIQMKTCEDHRASLQTTVERQAADISKALMLIETIRKEQERVP